jgi:signal transduction histidine kinase
MTGLAERFWPKTLFGQTLTVLLIGMALALLAGALIYSNARQEAVRAVGALGAAERIVNVTRLVAEAPAEWRERLVAGFGDATFDVALSPRQPTLPADSGGRATQIIAEYLQPSLGGGKFLVAIEAQPSRAMPATEAAPQGYRGPGMGLAHGMHAAMYGEYAGVDMHWSGLFAAVELPDGAWLTFSTSLPSTGQMLSGSLLLALAVMAGMIVLLTAWAVRRMTAPVRVLSEAALRFGRNLEAPPLSVSGSIEMRRAAETFNDMQHRLRQLISGRTLMLAAISHDLRTQLTLLRLRTEAADPGPERERMLATIDEMAEMLSATLAVARDDAADETKSRVDLGALVASVVDDMADVGLAVEVGELAEAAILECKPNALRRALTNLIDNAVKYGESARVGLMADAAGITIVIEDQGPGIPEAQLSEVLQPFFRLEGSRSRDTGGIGLGLAIAASVIEAHGGALSLRNRPEGGLLARVWLPKP